jgi:RNA polymerase sigma-70 factor, ECF subfamily
MSRPDFSAPGFLEELRTRDPAAWGALVDEYLPQLFRAGRGMGFSADECRDLAQSAFLALVESLGRFEGRSHLRTYLFGIFYNKVSGLLREKYRAEEQDPIDEVMESRFDSRGNWRQPPADIEKQVYSREIRERVRECMEAIPQMQRAAFYLREVEGMETGEICKKMAISATNLGVILFRARNRLRECLERKGLK